MPKSKSFALFANRIEDARLQLDGIDACIEFSLKHLDHHANKNIKIGSLLNATKGNLCRKIPVKQRSSFINRLKKTNYEYIIHVLYTYFSEYLRLCLFGLYENNPLKVIGKAPGTLHYHEVVKLGDFEIIKRHIVDQVFKQLESKKSTSQLLKNILSHTGINVPEEIATPAIMYLEVRHLLVHNVGMIDKDFISRFGEHIKVPLKEGGKFQINKGFALNALMSIYS